MSHFEFVLPLNKEDLRTADDPSQYHVSDLVDPGDLNRKIEGEDTDFVHRQLCLFS